MYDGCADAQVALGSVLFLSEWDWTGAERSLRRALDINPAHPEGLLQYGSLMEALGHLEQGLRFKQQALERIPASRLRVGRTRSGAGPSGGCAPVGQPSC